MTQFLSSLLTASIHGSIVILAVILLRLLLRKTPKKFICLLWLLAGIRLLMPFEIRSDLSLQPEPRPVMQQIIAQEAPDPLPYETAPVQPDVQIPVEEAFVPVFSPNTTNSETVTQPETIMVVEKPVFSWMSILPWMWLGVASLFVVYTLFSYIRLRLLVRESVKIEGGWECDRIETAFILGFIRPQIYIPMGMAPLVRKHILAHERTHLEKGDHWFKMIGFIALSLHWFNPLVWIAYILLCRDIELACDERVVQFMELPERKEYSAALLLCSSSKVHFAACPVAFGEVSVKERITSVLKYKKPGFWISMAGVIAIVFVAVCLVTSPSEGHSSSVSAGAENTITVETVDQLLDAIAPNTEIILRPGTYNLCKAKTYGGETGSDYYSWVGGYDGSELVIHNVENLTIRGSGRLSTTIETVPRWSNVIHFLTASNVTLEGFTAGHTDQGECSGGVLYLEDCNAVSMNDLGLYGCGVVGLTTDKCKNISLTGSEIYDCSSSAAVIRTSFNVTISGCRIYDIGREDYGGYVFFEMANSQNVTVDNCEFSLSTLNHLITSSFTQAIFRNNLFTGNRFRTSAFSIQGEDVVFQDNRFDSNTVRAWYDVYGSTVFDENGTALTEAVLQERYPEAPKQASQPQLAIHVKTVDELIAAIGPNTEIILDGEFYDFSAATGYGYSSGTYYYWEDVFDGPGLVIRNVDNMTIRSSDGNVKNHTLSAVPRYADVLAFSACSNVTLSGFTAGHTTEPGSCAGGVIEFRDCDNMSVDNCGLYGCGILGVYAEYSKNIYVTNSEIYECSQGGIQMRDTDTITISGNTFRDLGGDETSFIGCTNIRMDGQTLNPQTPAQKAPIQMQTETVVDEQDLHNLGEALTCFAEALFAGDEATMGLYLSSDYDLPITIPQEIIGATLSASQELPGDYPAQMEAMGYCTAFVQYDLPTASGSIPARMTVEMCRELGGWKVQYYTLGDTEADLLDKVLWNFTYAYLHQELEEMEIFLSEEYTGPRDVYFGNGDNALVDPNYSVSNTFASAQLARLNAYSAAVPFRESGKDTWTYLNIALHRRENPKTYTESGIPRQEPEWEVVDYGVEGISPNAYNIQYLPGNIQIETILRETYTGTVLLIKDPSRVFLGTSNQAGFAKDIPGKQIGEMFEAYPDAIAAVSAGAFFDDGTANAAVGSHPLGLTISQGKTVWNQGEQPGIPGFVGFNTSNELIVRSSNLTEAEAKALNIRDGVAIGPALIINREVLAAAYENSGYGPRTAIGQREDGTVILLCINGRVFGSLGATYREVADEMITYGAVNAALLQGGSATGMMCRADGAGEPQLLTSVRSIDGTQDLQPRKLPTYWMIAGD